MGPTESDMPWKVGLMYLFLFWQYISEAGLVVGSLLSRLVDSVVNYSV